MRYEQRGTVACLPQISHIMDQKWWASNCVLGCYNGIECALDMLMSTA